MTQSITAAASGTKQIITAASRVAGTVALIAAALLIVLFLLQENGLVLSTEAAHFLHEATHDARHALGVPCH
ncbi:CbtB domain-containing protein [Paenarthrobacter nitroguajacolicus]|uniref:CbtB domain-containing protein n=1 Tax=Paenarthrobacter nitroguajacolicus TaxID=211146 RepID=UPI00248CA8B8|nr:CbtB-domain containing protein [Paenarthrobacter nitroguajacolicus]MDI2037249.1 hypothetical protein [Paenarthrobacter nitroguajacolicus]